jgi:LPXTG-motif cell wall-anchored protein
MLNFDVTSLPDTGAWMMFTGMMLTLVAFFLGWKTEKSTSPEKAKIYATS